MKKIPVQALYDNCRMMLDEHWGYIYGTAGVKCTQAVIDQSIERFPKNADMTRRYGKQWLGRMVTDCSGVMAYIWKKYGKSIPHGSTSMVSQKFIVDFSSTPKPGYAALVDPTPDTDDNNHIGIVAEDGKHVYEARGTAYGFVYSELDKRFTKFGRFADVDYGEGSEIMPSDDGTRVYHKARVNTNSGPLNVRSGPGTDNDVIFKIPKGTIVDVMFEYENGWAFVDEDGDQGYVDGRYLRRIESSEPSSDEGDQSPSESDQCDPGPLRTILRHVGDDNITIELVGKWEVYGIVGGSD